MILIFIFYILLNNNVECQRSYNGPFTYRLANYIIDYFQLDKLERLSVYNELRFGNIYFTHHADHLNYTDHRNHSNYSSCDSLSLNSIEDYFFRVYASQDNFTLQELDDLIHFHVKKSRRIENENRHRQYRCQRQYVSIF